MAAILKHDLPIFSFDEVDQPFTLRRNEFLAFIKTARLREPAPEGARQRTQEPHNSHSRIIPQADGVLSAVGAQHLLYHDARPHDLEGRHALPAVGRGLLELLAEDEVGGGRLDEGLLLERVLLLGGVHLRDGDERLGGVAQLPGEVADAESGHEGVKVLAVRHLELAAVLGGRLHVLIRVAPMSAMICGAKIIVKDDGAVGL